MSSSASLWIVEHRSARVHLGGRRATRRALRRNGAVRFGLVLADVGSTRSGGLASGWTPLRREFGFAI